MSSGSIHAGNSLGCLLHLWLTHGRKIQQNFIPGFFMSSQTMDFQAVEKRKILESCGASQNSGIGRTEMLWIS